MDPERWRQIDELLGQALEAPPDQRAVLLDAACGSDEPLRSHVERLLRAHDQAHRFLTAPAPEGTPQSTRQLTDPLIGRTVGAYAITSRLGAGGMGVVYLARDLRLERTVALKFLPLHLTFDDEQKARFLREAKASAALEHPNIGAIHEVEEAPDGRMFLVIAYYDGETLRQRIQRGPLSIDEAVGIASQIAAGLAHAHDRRVVHRDIKPGNILLTRDGTVRIIDFGLARLGGLTKITKADRVMGTVAYVSPEQARGENVDERADVWSLGAVLYEMLAGQVPFQGQHPETTIHAILTGEPRPLVQFRSDVPPAIDRVISRALQKDPQSRYQSAAELLNDLVGYRSGATLAEQSHGGRAFASPWGWLPIASIVALLVLASMTAWLVQRQNRQRWARETLLPQITRLVDDDQHVAAFALAREAERYIPGDARLLELWPRMSRLVSVRTTPPGADVYMKPYEALDADWVYLGQSPLEKARIPPGLYRWRAEKSGFGTAEEVASGTYRPVSLVLDPVDSIPAGMVRVTGGPSPYGMIVSGFENVEPVTLDDFWMDRHEVSNRQFRQFVNAGSYQKPELWKHPFVEAGRVLSWKQAMTGFRDATGRPGPAMWEGGDYPTGQDDHPVGGVSWYEAAAYCEFAGRRLPTVYHWNRAAITGDAWISSYIFPFSNFGGGSAAPIGSHQGMSRSGTYDLAGNVKEWAWNEAPQQKRYILGGAWNEPAYMFHEADGRAPLQREPTFGFRCIKDSTASPPAPRLTEPVVASVRRYANERPVPDVVFRVYREMYAYDQTPLNVMIESTDSSRPEWIEQRISFDAAYGNERMAAVLFLPRNATPPFQTIVHFPGAESMFVASSEQLVDMPRIDYIIKSGRAVLWPIYKGTYERRVGLQTYFPNPSVRYRDHVIHWAKDVRRSIDYLETRSDIDTSKLAFYGYSWGACLGGILPAVEPRLKVNVLMGPGLYLQRARPEVDQINFVSRVTIPTLIVDGRDDFVFPPETSQKPFYQLLGTPSSHKRLRTFDGGHSVPRHHLIRESLNWLDRYLGPVERIQPLRP